MSGWDFVSVIVLIGVVVMVGSRFINRLVIREFERGVVFTRGRLTNVLGAGAHWLFKPFQSVQVIDIRSAVLSVPGQEVLSGDNIAVKVSLAIRFHVADPALAVRTTKSYTDALYLEAQLIIRDLIGALPIEELLQQRQQLAAKLQERLAPKAAELGLALETIGVKDIMFPGGLKQIFAQVVEARKAAQASLEKARGETATLRSLANAAKMLEGNPALVTLKTLQTASDGKHTLVLGLSQPIIPITKEVESSSQKPQLPSQGQLPSPEPSDS